MEDESLSDVLCGCGVRKFGLNSVLSNAIE